VDHFSSIFNSLSFVVIPNNAHFTFSTFSNVPSISDSDIEEAIQHLSPLRCVSPDEIPSFIIKGCSEIFCHFLSHIFYVSLLQAKFPTLRKKVAIMPVFKKDNSALITNYRPITM
jgi:hypothetical protein